jgi:hypothetical protein
LASAAIRPFFDSLVGVMCRELPPKIIAENDWTNAANQHGIEFFLNT